MPFNKTDYDARLKGAIPKIIELVTRRPGLSDQQITRTVNGLRWYVRALVYSGQLTAVEVGDELRDVRLADNSAESAAKLKATLVGVEEKLLKSEEKLEAAVQGIAAANKRAEEVKQSILEVRVVPFNDKGKVKSTKGVFHRMFKQVLELAQARMNIFIYGPTGSGKTFIAEQVAKALNLEFSFVSCTSGMSESVLGGRLMPVGKQGTFEYIISEFLKRYEHGGVFLLDEIDAADPNVMLFTNAALANGKCAVPNRPSKPYAEKHPDFICIAAANTVGLGADRLYSGRNKLDAAFLDRFGIGKVMLDYDPVVENHLCPDETLRNRLLAYRQGCREHNLERAVSTRFMHQAYCMKNGIRPSDGAKLDFAWGDDMIDKALFEGWREDEINKVKAYTR